MPAEGKGCHFWTYVTSDPFGPAQERTCYLLNSCDKVIQPQAEVVSGERDCDPLDFLIALGEILANNIAALKGAKTALEVAATSRRRKVRAAATDCTELIALVEQREFSQEMQISFYHKIIFYL